MQGKARYIKARSSGMVTEGSMVKWDGEAMQGKARQRARQVGRHLWTRSQVRRLWVHRHALL